MAVTRTTFVKGGPIPKSPGRPKITPEERARREEMKRKLEEARIYAANFDFKGEMSKLLPQAVVQAKRILNAKGSEPSLMNVKVRLMEFLRDTIYGKPAQTLLGPGGGPILTSFAMIVSEIDGAKPERFDAAMMSGGRS